MTAAAGPADNAGGQSTRLAVAEQFRAAVESGRLDLPLPGSGRTGERFAVLASMAGDDLSLARLGEGHADAIAILAELGGPEPEPSSRWGVWAANPPGPRLEATRSADGWSLRGIKQYCSGARICSHALVTADSGDGPQQLFAVSTGKLTPQAGSWPSAAMAASDTLQIGFDDVPAEPVGPPGGYTHRPGFSHGGIGVAACWFGGARAVGQTLLSEAAKRDVGPHALAHLGAVDIALRSAHTALAVAADEIDADPGDRAGAGPARALRVRALAEASAAEVMSRVGRALGAGPLSMDEVHSRRVADLALYLRQHHAERDLAELGGLIAERGTCW